MLSAFSLFLFRSARLALAAAVSLCAAVAQVPEATPKRDVETSVRGEPDAPPIPVKRAKNTIGTLLYVQTPQGTVPVFSRIKAAAAPQPGAPNVSAELTFDRFMGPLHLRALDQLAKGVQGLHKGWPRGQNIEIAFLDKPTPVELEPAVLPCALMLDSLLRDWDIEQNYAVVGTLKPDGTIEAVGGIAGRLAGAARSRVARIAVPAKNESQVADYLLAEGINAFLGTQIFAVAHYNDAGVLALTKLDPRTEEVVTLFGSVQRTLAGVGVVRAVDMLHTEGVQGTLRRVLEKAPNHISAQVLLDWGTGKRTQISFSGSTEAIDRHGADLVKAFRALRPDEALKTPKGAVADDISRLRVLRGRVDERARGWVDALLRYGDALQKAQSGGSRPSQAALAALDAAREAGNQEWVKLVQARQEAATQKAE
jgi:hypothetical protein